MKSLEIYAGPTAKKIIEEEGFSPSMFKYLLGASGGPKWFTLFGLDKYIFGEFFKSSTHTVNAIGSSAGAFRFACFAQNNPVQAIETLAKLYSETVYSAKPTAEEITRMAVELLDAVLGSNGVSEIVNNDRVKAHFIVARTKGIVASENKILQSLGLFKSFANNAINRGKLAKQYERVVFKQQSSQVNVLDHTQIPTAYINLTNSNLKQALLASGSIPLVLKGVPNIPDAPIGMYRDGGIIDYHFDFSLSDSAAEKRTNDLILYPHFNNQPKAGWFDKHLKRKPDIAHYNNTVMLAPSEGFIRALPYSKIPDRKDFTALDANTRLKFWRTVLSESERLAEDFDDFINKVPHNIKLLSF
ncbi:patatin-like phospholipase family protein [Flocculibacter collagenilyticus]|uniref:patatin-like phospholipase family protein n=1 Tax=Flocculibacter collagenilyticus TaxID=2744479 RepID=UPI0018F77A18|nr:patatin-like phospholipase family protein [Flocculibacter collagenilyticus]